MDARCQQVYTATFRLQGGYPERLTPDEALAIDELGEKLASLNEPITFVGDGAASVTKPSRTGFPPSSPRLS